ncbi:MFS transporter [Rubrivirga sp. IMCC45206]|uniref:MFS transporter n=1 Tax=Rubrivirga sp. IMCC45206 TaxID=3391614 RepID=UPI00398FCA60
MTLPAVLRTPRRRSAAAPFWANGVLYGTWASRIPEIQAQTGLGEGALGLALLGLAAGLVVSASAAGPLVARLGAHRVTLWALAVFAAGVVGPGLATGFGSLALALVGVGLASGLLDVAMNAWAAEVEAADGASILGACHGLFSLGGMVGAGIGALAAAASVPLGLHFGASGLVFAGATLVQGWRAWAPRSEAPVHDGPAVAWPTGPVAGLAALAVCGLVVEGAVADWGAVFMREVLAASPAVAALGFAAFSACMAGTRFGADALTDRWGDASVVRAGAAVGAVGLATVVLAPAVWIAVVGFGLVGLGMAAVVPALFRAASRAPLPPGVGIAAVASAGYLGFLAGPPVLGFVAEAAGLRVSFGLLVALAAAVALGSRAAFRKVRETEG